VADVQRLFHILYLFDPLAPVHADGLAWLKANIKDVIGLFTELVARHHPSNYLHEIAHHGIALLECGGLAAYANDTHETLQCLLKEAFHRFSARGGGGQKRTLRLIWERWFMRLHILVVSGYDHSSMPGQHMSVLASPLSAQADSTQ
jgi:hypothetical protein